MKILLLLPLLLSFSVPVIAHNEANGGNSFHFCNPPGCSGGGGLIGPPKSEDGEGEIECPPSDLGAC